MGSWLKNIFSSSYRKALKAEKTGDFLKAASFYLEAEEPEKALEMYLKYVDTALDTEESVEEKISTLNRAINIIESNKVIASNVEHAREIYIKQGSLFVRLAEKNLRSKEQYNFLIKQAATFFEKGEECSKAGELFEKIDLLEDAARCYEKAGEVEKLEKVLDKLNKKEGEQELLTSLYEEARLLIQTGERKQALEKLEKCVSMAKEDKTLYLEELVRLKNSFPENNSVSIEFNGTIYNLIGKDKIIIGRDKDCDFVLKDPEISRNHLILEIDNHEVILRDPGSRSGSFIGNIKIGDKLKIKHNSRIRLGRNTLLYTGIEDDYIHIEVVEGIDKGKKAFIIKDAWNLKQGISIRFDENFAVLLLDSPSEIYLNDRKAVVSRIYLLRGDKIEINGEILLVRE